MRTTSQKIVIGWKRYIRSEHCTVGGEILAVEYSKDPQSRWKALQSALVQVVAALV